MKLNPVCTCGLRVELMTANVVLWVVADRLSCTPHLLPQLPRPPSSCRQLTTREERPYFDPDSTEAALLLDRPPVKMADGT